MNEPKFWPCSNHRVQKRGAGEPGQEQTHPDWLNDTHGKGFLSEDPKIPPGSYTRLMRKKPGAHHFQVLQGPGIWEDIPVPPIPPSVFIEDALLLRGNFSESLDLVTKRVNQFCYIL